MAIPHWDPQDESSYGEPDMQTGSCHVWRHERAISEKEMEEWKKEDAERDAKRIPVGFSLPSTAPPTKSRTGRTRPSVKAGTRRRKSR